MRRFLHIILGAFLLVVPAGCGPDVPVVGDDQPQEKGPVTAVLDISVRNLSDFRGAATKGDFDPLAGTPGENQIQDFALYLFDASQAYKTDAGVKVFDPSAATQILAAPLTSATLSGAQVGDVLRIELTLPDAFQSLAVLMLANLGTSNYPAVGTTGSTMEYVAGYLSDRNNAATVGIAFNPATDYGGTVGIPLYGWKLFGDMSGGADLRTANALKFYKGMSTPLTKIGLGSKAAIQAYCDLGFVSADDILYLLRSLSRLRVSYVPAAGQPNLRLDWVKLHGYRDRIAPVPATIFAATAPTPFDAVEDWGNLKVGAAGDTPAWSADDVTFKSSAGIHYLYVPELQAATLSGAGQEPYLTMQVTDPGADGDFATAADNVVYVYTPSTITVTDALHGTVVYPAQGKTSWLHFVSRDDKTLPDGQTVVLSGTKFNLIRNYTFEWIASGITQ